MPEQFTVPQFIDAEDKIFGPITARQFIILLVTFLIDAALWKLLSFVAFLLTAIPILMIGGVFAFARINGQPFHYFLLNLIQTFKKPSLRVWDKTKTDAELKEYMAKKPPPPAEKFQRKAPLSTSRLQELTLVVNTGGVYKPDEE